MPQFQVEDALVELSKSDPIAANVLTRAALIGPLREMELALDQANETQTELSCEQSDQIWKAQEFRWELVNVVGAFLEAQNNEREAHKRATSRNKMRLVDAFFESVSGFRIDAKYDKEQLVELAGRYAASPELHAPPYTSFIAATIIDTELYPLRREVENLTDVMRAEIAKIDPVAGMIFQTTAELPGFAWIGILLVTLGAALSWALSPWLACGLIALALYLTISHLWRRRKIRQLTIQVKSLLQGFVSRLELVRDEIARGTFNSEATTSRLRQIEKDGAYVPSIVYTLLALRPDGIASTAHD